MRSPMDNSDDVESRAEGARISAKKATLQSVNPTEKSTAVEQKKITIKKATKPKMDLDALVGDRIKFKKSSSIKSSYSLNVNLYQKAALFIVSAQEGMTKKTVIDNYSFNDIIKNAEKAGLDDSIVEELFDSGKIK